MSIETVFYVQIGSILAFLTAMFVLYRLLVSSKDATIETLKQQISFLEVRIKAAAESAPEVLLLRKENLVNMLTKELEVAVKETEVAIKEKEPLRTEIEELKQRLSMAKMTKTSASGQFLANQVVERRSHIADELRRALEGEEFILEYQPQLDLKTRKVTGVEALLRWDKPGTGLVWPAGFVPILEEYGLIVEVERWVLKKAAETYLDWHRRGLSAVRIAINVSTHQMRSSSFTSEVKQMIAAHDRLKSGLELEVTEVAVSNDVDYAAAGLSELRAAGVRIAIDDFGTGYSSLSTLKRIPLDRLKIDRSFIHDLNAEQASRDMVSAIVNLAHSLDLNVIAEGVETEEQLRLLQSMNCDEIQGNVFERPLPVHLFEIKYLTHIERP